MHFDLTSPCPQCPFRTDIKPFLTRPRAKEIADGLLHQQATFACHKTTEHNDDGEHVLRDSEQHCAGALIVLEKMNRPNQMMRIMERIRLYNRHALKMEAPVFDTLRAFIAAQGERRARGKANQTQKR